MAQESDKAQWSTKPWAGTLDQLVRATRLCAKEVEEATPYPAGYDPEDHEQRFEGDKRKAWNAARDADRGREMQILIVEREGFQRVLTSIEDLAEWPVEEIARIERIDIDIGGNGYLPVSANIEVLPRGLEIRACGRDRTWTAGLRQQLEQILEPKVRLRPRGLRDENWSMGMATAAWIVCFAGATAVLKYATSLPSGAKAGLALAISLVVSGFVLFLGFRLPEMELLAQGTQPTYQRWKGKIITAAVTIAFGVLGSIIAAAVWS